MAILLAVAIPVFSSQLENAREAVDKNAARSAMSLAEADYLLNHPAADSSGNVYYSFVEDANHNLVAKSHTTVTDAKDASTVIAQSQKYKGKDLTVTIDKDGKATPSWEIQEPSPSPTAGS